MGSFWFRAGSGPAGTVTPQCTARPESADVGERREKCTNPFDFCNSKGSYKNEH